MQRQNLLIKKQLKKKVKKNKFFQKFKIRFRETKRFIYKNKIINNHRIKIYLKNLILLDN